MAVVHYQQVDERQRMHKGVEREHERLRLKKLKEEEKIRQQQQQKDWLIAQIEVGLLTEHCIWRLLPFLFGCNVSYMFKLFKYICRQGIVCAVNIVH